MPSTITLQSTLNWASPMVKYLPLSVGAYLEPALASANLVRQTMLAAPFAWAWNRSSVAFTAVPGQQDYPIAVADFGYLEQGSVQDMSPKWFQMKTVNSLALDSAPGRPHSVAPDLDDGQGTITFRLLPVPDKAYSVNITYQRSAVVFTGLSNTWSPIPDHLVHIAKFGFLALAMMHSDDPRFPLANQKFMSSLLAAAEGLGEIERNIFIGNWSALTETGQQKTQQGIQSRQY